MNESVLVFAAGVAPALIWLALFWWWDRYEREPFGLVLALFLTGMFPVALLAGVLDIVAALALGGDPVTGAMPLLAVVVVAPVVEESLKYLGARTVALRRSAFTEPVDGIVYGTAVGLGFAAIENVSYLLSTIGEIRVGQLALDICAGLTATECSLATVLPVRAFGSTLVHALAGGLAGFTLTRRRFHDRPDLIPAAGLAGLGAAIALHAGWNLGAATGSPLVSLLVLVLGSAAYRSLFRRCLALSPRARFGRSKERE